MLCIPFNVHGTHEHTKGIRPPGLTKFAIINTDYRAFDIYNADDFSQEIKNSGINRDELWLQVKEIRTDFYYSYSSSRPSIKETFNLNLAILDTNYIDSYAAWLVDDTENFKFSKNSLKKWEQLEELYREGKVNYVGFEHLEHMDHLEEIYNNAKIKPTILHLQKFSPEILRYCLENGIIFQYFGIPGLINASQNIIITGIAQTHNVSVKQVLIKLLAELGMQPLTGGNSQRYLSENADLNFELSDNEIAQLIKSGVFGDSAFNKQLVDSFPLMDIHLFSNVLEKNTNQMLAIYEDLQNGSLVKLNDVVARLINCLEEQMPIEIEKLAHYIPKLDPTSLANIITNQSPIIVDHLKQFGANFTEITSSSYAKIIGAHGLDYITILQEKLSIPAEKLLLASLSTEDASYFNQLFVAADLNKIIRHDIVAIVKIYPETLEKFIFANIKPEFLLMAATTIGNKAIFDDLLAKCDISKLYGNEITEIILQFGPQVINQLSGYHFYRLTTTDLDKIVTSLGIDGINELTNHDVSPNILLAALRLGGIELFNELAPKIDVTKLESINCIRQMLKYSEEQILDALIKHNVPADKLLFAVKSSENNILLFKQIISKANLSTIDEYTTSMIIKQMIDMDDAELLQEFSKTNIDLTKLSSYSIFEILNQIIHTGKIEWLHELPKVNIDLTKLDFYIMQIVERIIDRGEIGWLQELPKASIDLTKLDSYPYSIARIVNKIIDLDKPEWFQELAESGIETTKLSSYDISIIIKHIIDLDKPKWFQKLNKFGIDAKKIDEWNISGIIEKVIDINKPEFLQELVIAGIDGIKLQSYRVSEIVKKITNLGKSEWLYELSKANIDLTKLYSSEIDDITKKAINTKQFEWIKALRDNKLDFSKVETQDKLFIEQLEKCHSDIKCYSECFTKEADITQYNSECVGEFAFSDNEL